MLNRRRGKRPYRGFESRPLRVAGVKGCLAEHTCSENKEITAGKPDGVTSANNSSQVPADDSTNTANVPNSDKLDNKLSNKPTELAVVVKAWPELPEAIRSAIATIVRASAGKRGR